MKEKFIIWHDKTPEDKQEFWINQNQDLLEFSRELGFEDSQFPYLNFQRATK